jgi:hypothetical protein
VVGEATVHQYPTCPAYRRARTGTGGPRSGRAPPGRARTRRCPCDARTAISGAAPASSGGSCRAPRGRRR